jgi:hypothetical protein
MKKGSNWNCHPNDHMSVHMWTLEHHENVFFLQEENKTKDLPFTIGIQTPLQIGWLLEFGHNGVLSMDVNFGTNVQRHHLFTLMVFDHHCQGLPIAWVITSW